MFPTMRIEAAKRPLDLRAGGDDGAVDVDRQARYPAGGQCFEDELVIQSHEGRERGLRELLEPVTDRARARDSGHAAEPCNQRIAGQVAEMLQAARANVEERDQEQRKACTAIVARERRQRAAQPSRDVKGSEVAADELQPAIRREPLPHKLDGQIILDCSPPASYLQVHQRGLRVTKRDMGMSTALIRRNAPLMHVTSRSIPALFSDQG